MNRTLHLMNHHPECPVSIGPVVGKGLTLERRPPSRVSLIKIGREKPFPFAQSTHIHCGKGITEEVHTTNGEALNESFTDEIAMHHKDVEQKRGEVFVQNGLSSQSSNGGVV